MTVGFASIIGGKPSSVRNMTEHLLTQTLSQDLARSAQSLRPRHAGRDRGGAGNLDTGEPRGGWLDGLRGGARSPARPPPRNHRRP